jgi:uncharacterized membrane protein YbaN (DUF454 family)
VVTLDELGIVLPLLASILIPIVILSLSRYLRSSDTLSNRSVIAEQRLKNMEEDINSIQSTRKEIWDRLGSLEKAVFNMCWRMDKLERNNNTHHE